MALEIHYEIFARQGAKGGWRMLDVHKSRESAIALAKTLMSEQRATGVKVVKETYNEETGDYLSLKIYEDGHNKLRLAPAQEDTPHALPCFKPDDLYSYHARATISRLLADWLARNRLTFTELSHRADALEKLEATGTLVQHAIQKVAVAQAATTTTPVQQIVKSLNELVNRAIQRVYRDHRNAYFPFVEADGFSALAAKLQGEADGLYVLNGALAKHLKDARGWDEKVLRLIRIMESAEGEGRDLLMTAIDAIVAEILSGPAALHELIGPEKSFREQLASLIDLFLGNEPEPGASRDGLAALTHHFAADDLPEARTAIAQRLLAEFKSMKRFCPESLDDELKTMRLMADRLVRGVGKYLGHEDLVGAFTLRSKRLVTHETINTYLASARTPEEKLNRLFAVEENIIGQENKRRLSEFLIPVLTSPAFEDQFQDAKVQVLPRLRTLAALQARALRSGFQEEPRSEMAGLLDRMACEVELRAKLFDTIVANARSPVDCAVKLLTLCTGCYFTEGRLASRARELILAQLGKPGFLSDFAARQARDGNTPDREAATIELVAALGKAGIDAETGLKSMAA